MNRLPADTGPQVLASARWTRGLVAIACVALTHIAAMAQEWSASDAAQKTLPQWLDRMKRAAIEQRYVGTYVVSSPNGAMSSARIWHAGDGRQQVERIQSLTGAGRLTFRHDNEVLTLLPEPKLAYTERYAAPARGTATGDAVATNVVPERHRVKLLGSERVAGVEAWALQVTAQDRHRYSYRIWSEKRTGLVLKSDTLDDRNHVVEQSGFSDLQLPAKVDADDLLAQMRRLDGYRLQVAEWTPLPAAQTGWAWPAAPVGFALGACSERQTPKPTLQCRLSDGMASVTVFVEIFDASRHVGVSEKSLGATHAIVHRVTAAGGDWWLTLMGEAPPDTLKAIAAQIRRR